MKLFHAATRVGAIVAAAIAPLSWLSDFFIIACLAGAFAAAWFAIRIRQTPINFKDGA